MHTLVMVISVTCSKYSTAKRKLDQRVPRTSSVRDQQVKNLGISQLISIEKIEDFKN